MKLSVCLITLNEAQNLERCLASVQGIADEIVVVDSGSTDATEIIALRHKARFIHQPWLGFVGQKNKALSLAAHPWVLSLDGDEELSTGLRGEIQSLKASWNESQHPGVRGFSMPRCVLYEGRWIRHGDWYPDRLTRLFQRSHARFAGGKVHERLELEGEVRPLRYDLHHYSFSDRADHWKRCQHYARLWAETQAEIGRDASWLAPWSHSFFRWLRAYILKRGFLDGRQGWQIARLASAEVRLKYALLRKLRRESRG